MTTEEKLNKAIEFIKKIEQMNFPTTTIGNLISAHGTCLECDSDDVSITIPEENDSVIEPKTIQKLQDDAWHILVDIAY